MKVNKWDSAEIFIAVIDEGSFTAAADALELSKAQVSRQINQLETRLGIQLIKRSTRKLALTETGRAYYERCKGIVHQMAEVEQSIIDQRERPIGTLKLTVAGAFGELYIAPCAADFMKKYPDVHIDIDFTNRLVDIVAEGYDVAIRAGVLKESSLMTRKIARRRLILCGTRDYFDRHGKPTAIADLRKHNCLVGTLASWRFRERNGRHIDVKIDGNWHSNNGHALMAAARKGLGLVQLPEFYVFDDIRDGRLIPVLEEFEPVDTAEWALYPSSKHLSPKGQLFIHHLVSSFEDIAYF
jgi:DNA-binding transcriptional LysR family regulator